MSLAVVENEDIGQHLEQALAPSRILGFVIQRFSESIRIMYQSLDSLVYLLLLFGRVDQHWRRVRVGSAVQPEEVDARLAADVLMEHRWQIPRRDRAVGRPTRDLGARDRRV